MRVTLVSAIAAGVFAALICAFALVYVNHVVQEIDTMRIETLECVQAGDDAAARERFVQLASHWQASTPILEMISSHDDVHEVASAILDAQVCLEVMDADDLLRVLEQLGTALEHIRSIQRVSITNLY